MADQREGQELAYLIFNQIGLPEADQPKARCLPICANDEFDVGRQDVANTLHLEDRSVSTHHLRVRCVVYDDDEERRVAPMVYVRVLSSHPVILRRYRIDDQRGGLDITRDNGDILLNSRDTLQLTNQVSVEFQMRAANSRPPPLDKIRKAEVQKFADRYQMTTRVLGVGGYAAVYVAVKQSTGQQFACKIIALPTKDANEQGGDFRDELELVRRREHTAREYNVLSKLSHPNIVTLEKVCRTTHTIYLFQELITGGDLLSYLDMTGPLHEPEAAMIVRQVLEAVKYLHDNYVVHRDIKPENILMTCWRQGARVVLTDFGQSRTIADMETAAKKAGIFRMQTVVGTLGYTAPEVFAQQKKDLQHRSGYSQAIDIWSVGCVAATCLTNDVILPDALDLKTAETTQLVKCLDVLDYGKHWDKVGWRAKDFIRGCLAPHEDNRLSATACLEMDWFSHPYYRADFDAAYKRAIQDWKPKEHNESVIEVIDTSNSLLDRPAVKEQTSRHFPVMAPPPARTPKTERKEAMAARWRPDELHASPIQVPNSPPSANHYNPAPRAQTPKTQDFAAPVPETQSWDLDEMLPPPPASLPPSSSFQEHLGRNLASASENMARNRAASRQPHAAYFPSSAFQSKQAHR